jgi:hypothetical protein
MADYEKPLIHVVDANGNKVPATVSMLTSGGGGGGGGGGDASAANQVIGNTSLANIDGKLPVLVNGKVPVDIASLSVTVNNANLEISNDVGNPVPVSGTFWQATQPVSASSLPLPSGAATSSLQTTANTSLSSIDTKTPVLGQALAAASTPVVLPAAQITALTPPTSVGISGTLPAFAATPTFTANAGTNLNTSLLALESGGNLASINTKLPSNLTVSATRLLVDGSGVTQPISMVNAPLGVGYMSTVTITRAANTTSYTANDVYGTVFEITSVGASGGYIFLDSIDIMFNITSLPTGMGGFSVYLYSSSPPSAITDNLPFSVSSGDRASLITKLGIDLTASLARGGGTVVAERVDIKREIKLATGSTSLWAYLVTLGAFTPVANSETATITVRSFAL